MAWDTGLEVRVNKAEVQLLINENGDGERWEPLLTMTPRCAWEMSKALMAAALKAGTDVTK